MRLLSRKSDSHLLDHPLITYVFRERDAAPLRYNREMVNPWLLFALGETKTESAYWEKKFRGKPFLERVETGRKARVEGISHVRMSGSVTDMLPCFSR